ncbi:hypothetical protein BC628DRAFT_344017 [Trametes gibbosa]|nr:hypothetical protein BC628DRAFT_344017 [Trametes gibbosa]
MVAATHYTGVVRVMSTTGTAHSAWPERHATVYCYATLYSDGLSLVVRGAVLRRASTGRHNGSSLGRRLPRVLPVGPGAHPPSGGTVYGTILSFFGAMGRPREGRRRYKGTTQSEPLKAAGGLFSSSGACSVSSTGFTKIATGATDLFCPPYDSGLRIARRTGRTQDQRSMVLVRYYCRKVLNRRTAKGFPRGVGYGSQNFLLPPTYRLLVLSLCGDRKAAAELTCLLVRDRRPSTFPSSARKAVTRRMTAAR